ncbi:MAG TPA: immunoglobulin domain-containing protein, partial [Verrucomicrobiae bacterium]
PITVTGYTHDFIVEAGAAKRGRVFAANGVDNATSQSMDNTGNTGNAWYEMGYNVNNPDGGGVPIPDPSVLTNTGLPAAGTTITNAEGDHVYTLPPDYTRSNAVWVAADTITNGTITLVTPTAASVLSLLASAGNGPVNNIHVITSHADQSTETNLVNVANWFDGTPYVYGANGRVAVDTAQLNTVRNTARNPRLYPIDLVLANSVSPITSIDIINTNTSGGRIAILALSGTLETVKPFFLAQPQSVTVNVGANVQFTAVAAANSPITYQWQKGANGVFVDLANGGNVSGVTTPTLTINSAAEVDDADYRLVATDAAGSVNSAVAFLTVLSPLASVTAPTDTITAYQPLGGSSPAAEVVAHAIDGVMQKYLNNGNGVSPMSVPVGFIVKPAMGRTVVSAMRLYTANDASERDPANYILEGSVNGGVTWTLISSNAINMPTGRNTTATATINPLTQALRQVRFANTVGYTSYRWYTTKVRGSTSQFQIGEVELLGAIDTSPAPYFSTEPTSVFVFDGETAFFNAAAGGTPAPTLSWQRNTGSGFVALSDGGNIAGSQTGNLTVFPVSFSDAGDYICIATNSSGSVTSLVARLNVLSSLTDVTTPTDTITSFGDTSTTYPADSAPGNAIDNTTSKYRNGGMGLNAFTEFPPYEGPAGIIVAPAAGHTLVTGMRIYAADGNTERDPTSFELAGSTDGTSFTVITSGVLDLPLARNAGGLAIDPRMEPMQEVLFANTQAYTSYKLTVNHVRSDLDANSFQFAELELLGVAVAAPPRLSIAAGATAGTLVITTTATGTLWSSADLVNWQNEGQLAPGTPVTITIGTAGPIRFYQIRP